MNLRTDNTRLRQPPPSNLIHTKDNLSQLLANAKSALDAGRVKEAADILNDQTIETIRKIVDNDPSKTDIIFIIAEIFFKNAQPDKAEQWYKKILNFGPNAAACNKLGAICQYEGRLYEALQYQKQALDINHDRPELWANLARVLIETRKTQEGIDLLRKAVEKMPDNPHVHSNLLFRLHHLPDLDPQMLFDEHKKWAKIHAPITKARKNHKNNPDSDRRLRIGYVSPDFRAHPVMCFFESLLDGHNHREMEIYGYGCVELPDAITDHLQSKFDHYRNIYGQTDEDVVDLITHDRIDILVDLTGHTGNNRLTVFAQKPAPVQVTYLGYPDTTGMSAIDYRLTDSLTNPPQSQQFYTEKLIALPGTFACYKPPEYAPPLTPLPAEKNGFVTFGSFNNGCKMHPFIMSLWVQILNANQNSRLLLRFKGGNDRTLREYYFNQFEQLGTARDRVDIDGWKSPAEHLQMYSQVDIALDTFPLNGHTTTCEALWMGVPTMSLVGQCHPSRFGLSVLSCLGLDFFASSAHQDYVAKAAALAQNRPALANIRNSMRARMATGGLCCAKAFAKNVEAEYRKMWLRWCQEHS